ncbi:MAG: B12-binding domain-containing radical SAM protein [Desulfococcaceae bacterium]
MKLLFLEIETEDFWPLAAAGPAFIGAYLRENGHEAELLRVGPSESLASVTDRIKTADPELLGLSLTLRQWPRARQVVSFIRSEIEIPVIAGGLFPTFAAETVLSAEGFDFVCVGEGEGATVDLLEALARDPADIPPIPNIRTQNGTNPPPRPAIPRLDDLPFPARDLLDEHHGLVHLVTRRGCPFSCAYCSAGSYRDIYGGGYLRDRSPENVLAELRSLGESGGLGYVIFLDDTFNLRPHWLRAFLPRFRREIGAGFSIHARADGMDSETLALLADSGCRHVVYGVESGSERVRREILNRPGDNVALHRVFRQTRDAGMIVTANFMFGVPGETAAEIEETLALAESLEPDDFGFFVFQPFPGARLYDRCRAKGWLPPGFPNSAINHRRSPLAFPNLTEDQLEAFFARFEALRNR